jgi:hypothetical protein
VVSPRPSFGRVRSVAEGEEHGTRIGASARPGPAGSEISQVADQLGHADPAFTLRAHAHEMQGEETNLTSPNWAGLIRPRSFRTSGVKPLGALMNWQGMSQNELIF